MHQFIIRAIGKAQEDWQKEALEQYRERLRPFAKVELIELAEGHGGSAKPDTEKTRSIEAEHLLKGIPPEAQVITLEETGKNLSSLDFSQMIEREAEGGRPLFFLIGGSWGLHSTIRERAHIVLSFGKQTLPHLLARIVLVEQLYRAETILHGKTYHK